VERVCSRDKSDRSSAICSVSRDSALILASFSAERLDSRTSCCFPSRLAFSSSSLQTNSQHHAPSGKRAKKANLVNSNCFSNARRDEESLAFCSPKELASAMCLSSSVVCSFNRSSKNSARAISFAFSNCCLLASFLAVSSCSCNKRISFCRSCLYKLNSFCSSYIWVEIFNTIKKLPERKRTFSATELPLLSSAEGAPPPDTSGIEDAPICANSALYMSRCLTMA